MEESINYQVPKWATPEFQKSLVPLPLSHRGVITENVHFFHVRAPNGMSGQTKTLTFCIGSMEVCVHYPGSVKLL